MQDTGSKEKILILVNGTIRLTGAIQITGESSSLYSECFVLSLNAAGQQYIQHQIFKVHKPQHENDDFDAADPTAK